jgi:hypothetical protein
MTAKIATQVRSFPNNAALAQGTLVKMSGGFLAAAGVTDRAIGVMENRSFATDPVGAVRIFGDTAQHIASRGDHRIRRRVSGGQRQDQRRRQPARPTAWRSQRPAATAR